MKNSGIEHSKLKVRTSPGRGLPLSSFEHPEPAGRAGRVVPVFIPFAGCPGRCVYCAQDLSTGAGRASLEQIFENCRGMLEGLAANPGPARELAFYGGTFTSLPDGWPARFLDLAGACKERGVISRVRCSTRPDAVDAGMLAQMKKIGLDMVELGVQSFDARVLRASGRNYGPEEIRAGIDAVRSAGLALGVQLLPGLPLMDAEIFEGDVAETAASRPECARLYPCVVIEGTALARMWRAGQYLPWDLRETAEFLGAAVRRLWLADVSVIRVGLAPEPALDSAVLAGPVHPALGQLARSRALRLHIAEKIRELGRKPRRFEVPRRWISDIKGHKGEMLAAYESIGLAPDKIVVADGPLFRLF